MCSKLGIRFKVLRRTELRFVAEHLKVADLLINGIAWPERARREHRLIVTREMLRSASPRLIILDLSADEPNPIETVHSTTCAQPYYIEEGRVHISIYGYPALFPETSSRVYSAQVLPVVRLIADHGGLEGIARCGSLGLAIRQATLRPRPLAVAPAPNADFASQSVVA